MSHKALGKRARLVKVGSLPKEAWPEPDKERYPDKPCRCGGVAEHNGFQGEYWCSKCNSGFWEP